VASERGRVAGAGSVDPFDRHVTAPLNVDVDRVAVVEELLQARQSSEDLIHDSFDETHSIAVGNGWFAEPHRFAGSQVELTVQHRPCELLTV
jgi:hypothetical protein